MHKFSVIKKPVITEKSAIIAESSQYTFAVDQNSNKVEIKKAFKELYKTEPTEVRIINTKAKTSARRGIKKKGYKKAIIILKKGETIDLSTIK
jgi:large subunit ribosomal protein L23